MDPEIRLVTEEELPAFVDSLSTSFLDRPDPVKLAAEVRPIWDLSRAWAAFNDGRISGTFRSWATQLTVPGGGLLPGSAIAGVTVLPTHRRRGTLRAMVAAEHAAIRERGEAVGLLYASEYRIYGRFGYGPGCRVATWTVDARDAGFVLEPAGGVEFLTPGLDVIDTIRDVYDAARIGRPGEIRPRERIWEFDLGLTESSWGPRWKSFLVLRRDRDGNPDGYVRYRAEEKWVERQSQASITVDDFQAVTDEAHLALWSFLINVDLVATVKAEHGSPSERLPWLLTNARAARMSDVGDGLWVRLIDIPRALEARRYEREARLVLEVIDPEQSSGRIRLELDAGRDGATCRPIDRSPDLTLDVADLSAAYLGGTSLRNAVIAHGVDEHRDGALADADAVLRTGAEPWCSTFF